MKPTNELMDEIIGKLKEEIEFLKSLQTSLITGVLNYDIVEYLPLPAYNAYHARDYLSTRQMNILVTDVLIKKYCYFCGTELVDKDDMGCKRFFVIPMREPKPTRKPEDSDYEAFRYFYSVIDISK